MIYYTTVCNKQNVILIHIQLHVYNLTVNIYTRWYISLLLLLIISITISIFRVDTIRCTKLVFEHIIIILYITGTINHDSPTPFPPITIKINRRIQPMGTVNHICGVLVLERGFMQGRGVMFQINHAPKSYDHIHND